MYIFKNIFLQIKKKFAILFVSLKYHRSSISLNAYVSRNNRLIGNVCISDGCRVFDCNINTNTYLADNVSIISAHIGKYTSIGPGAKINLGNHPMHTVSTSPLTYSKETEFKYLKFNKVTIGNDVWIGANVLIATGISIGDGAVIGANSFINKNIPAYAIVVGSPGRIIGYRFDEVTIDRLLNIKWWHFDERVVSELKNNGDFDDVEAFIKKHCD